MIITVYVMVIWANAEILLEYHKIMPNNDVENIYKNMFFDASD